MTIELCGKEYRFEMTGTVGVLYTAEQYLRKIGVLGKGEPFNGSDPYHMCVLLYAVLLMSNKEVPSFDAFMSHLTSKEYGAMVRYCNETAERLEGRGEESASAEEAPGNA